MLVAYEALDRLSTSDGALLRSLGFSPPAGSIRGVANAVQEAPPLVQRTSVPWVFELFSGRGQLSRALWKAGFQVLSVDASIANAAAPTAKLNVGTDQGQTIFWDLFARRKPFALHIGAPCGTVQPKGDRLANQPKPLRSSKFPLGLPNLDEAASARVRSANAVYRFCYQLIVHCLQQNVCVSIARQFFPLAHLGAFCP